MSSWPTFHGGGQYKNDDDLIIFGSSIYVDCLFEYLKFVLDPLILLYRCCWLAVKLLNLSLYDEKSAIIQSRSAVDRSHDFNFRELIEVNSIYHNDPSLLAKEDK